MKKSGLLIIICLIVIALVVGGIFYFKGKPVNNTTNTNTTKEVIVLDEEIDSTVFTYKKVEIDPNTNKIRFYFNPKTDNYKNYILRLIIYSEDNNVIDNYEIYLSDYDSNKGFVTVDYTKDLSKANYYSVDLDIGPMVG